MANITLFTVPHTGTTFAVMLFRAVQFKKNAYRHVHALPQPFTDERMLNVYNEFVYSNKPLLVTARDPYLSAIRFVTHGNPIEHVARHWDTFLDTIESKKHATIDIGCRTNDRYDMLCDALDFGNIAYNKEIVKQYSDAWTPVSKIDTDAKLKYIETGQLPAGHNWEALDRAVDWYKNLPTNSYI